MMTHFTVADRLRRAIDEAGVVPIDFKTDPAVSRVVTDSIRHGDLQQAYGFIEKYGFTTMDISHREVNHVELMHALIRQLGVPSERQNLYEGIIKAMKQTFDEGPGTGLTAYCVPPHNDATQHSRVVDLMLFGYTSLAQAGAETGLTDMVNVLLRMAEAHEDRYVRVVKAFSSQDAATLSKQGMTWSGPLFTVEQSRAAFRFRQDEHINVNERYREEWQWLIDAVNDPRNRLVLSPSRDEFICIDNKRILHDRQMVLGGVERAHERAWIEEFARKRNHPIGICLDPETLGVIAFNNRR